MATYINVKVWTTNGLDTKYLFPGSQSHSQGRVQQLDENGRDWFYWHDATYKREAARLQYYATGSWISKDNGTDIAGAALYWSLYDPKVANATLGSVEIRSDTGALVAISVPSFASTTPDTAINDALNYGEAQLRLDGNRGNDTLRGSHYSDSLNGGKGSDVMIGGGGGDYYFVERSGDKVVEKRYGGNDTIITTVNLTLPRHVEQLYAREERDNRLTGNGLDNVFSGNNGDDTIKGLDGNDTLIGRDGRDVLEGGRGRDHFFFFAVPGKGNADIVRDFRHKFDVIEISQHTYFGLTAPVPDHTPLPTSLFHASNSGKAHDADDRILYDKNDGKLYFDPDGNGGTQRSLIATFTDEPRITAADILIV